MADRTGPDAAGPADEHRHADAALVQVSLAATQRAAAGERALRAAVRRRPAVVAAEKDDRVLLDRQFLEQGHEAADVAVHPRDHGGIVLLGLAPRLVGVGLVVGRMEFAVWNRVREVEKERLTFGGPPDETEGFLRHQIVRVDLAGLGRVAGELDLLGVPPQVLGPVVVGVALVQVAEPEIEALLVRDARRVGFAQAPLADNAGGVAGGLQDLADGHVLGVQRDAPLGRRPAGGG